MGGERRGKGHFCLRIRKRGSFREWSAKSKKTWNGRPKAAMSREFVGLKPAL